MARLAAYLGVAVVLVVLGGLHLLVVLVVSEPEAR
jgi:hypothetical protein